MEHIRSTERSREPDVSELTDREDRVVPFAIGGNAGTIAESHLIIPKARRGVDRSSGRQANTAPPPSISPFKRALDLVGAAALVVVLAPFLAVLAIVVTIAFRASPIFAHERIGKGGVPFRCYKFRSMCLDADLKLKQLLASDIRAQREWERTFKLQHDPRVTPLGRFLRSTSLDELPQLFNVLLGNMSLVGPRPIVQMELVKYGRHQGTYLSATPGLTGLWQVSGRSETSYRRRVAIDRVYVRSRSMKLDLWILLATIPAVLRNKGAI